MVAARSCGASLDRVSWQGSYQRNCTSELVLNKTWIYPRKFGERSCIAVRRKWIEQRTVHLLLAVALGTKHHRRWSIKASLTSRSRIPLWQSRARCLYFARGLWRMHLFGCSRFAVLPKGFNWCLQSSEEEGNLSIDVCSTASRWLWRWFNITDGSIIRLD